MQKFIQTLAIVALMIVPTMAGAQNTLTVADGTATNDYVPVYGYYADAYLRSQFVYPASDIAAATTTVGMSGGSITGMTFYATQSSVSLDGLWEIKLMEIASTTVSAFQNMTAATLVYTGTVGITGNQMTITFSAPYTYNGGNLLVEFTETNVSSSYPTTTFYGLSANGASVQGYSYSDVSSISPTQRNFMPKVTFTFTGGAAVTCPGVQGLSVTGITSDGATLNIVDTMNTGATYSISYWKNGGDTTTVTTTSTTYTFTGLDANSHYNYTVTVICSATDESVAIGGTFTTACGAMTLPFFVDFEDAAYNGAWYPCWDSTIHAGTDPSVNDQPGGSYNPTQHTPGGTYAMYLQGNSSESYNLVVGPAMDAVGNEINVSFWAMISNGWIKAGVITNPYDTTTFIPLVTITGGGWTEYEFNTSALDATANYRIAWLAHGSGYIGKFDDVSVSVYSGCSRPATASASNITAHTAQLTWDAVTGASTYNVYYGTVNDATSSSLQSLTVNDTTTTLTGLSGQTTYYAWVTTACGSDESDYRPFGNFTTLVSCPQVTNLTVDTTTSDGATISWNAGDVETQWEVVLDSNDAEVVFDSVYIITGLDAMTGHTLYVRPICDVDDTGAARSVSFATRCADAVCTMTVNGTDSWGDGWNGNAIEFYQAGVMVGSATISSGSSATIPIEVCSSAAVELRFASGNYAYEMGGDVTDGGGNTVFTISDMSSYSNHAVLATVANPCPDCVPPANIYVDNITADGAVMHWTAQDGQSSWIVRVDSTDYNVTDTFYIITGLDARTTYTALVATDCSGDTSNFASIQFTTDCSTGSCDITVVSTADYVYSYYCGTVKVYQNGEQVASVNAATQTVNVCSGMPVTFIYEAPYYGNYDNPSVTILDGGDAELFDGPTSSYTTGDTLVVTPNACPSCLTPTNVIASDIDSNELSFTWTMIDSLYGYLVSFNGGPWTSVVTLPYTEYSLTPNTAYTFSVMAVCTPGDTSNARTITVKTACGQMALPMIESFEADAAGTVPSCWTVVTPGYSNSPSVDNDNAHTGNNAISFYSNGTCMIASSAIPLYGDSIYVSFWADNSDYYPGNLEAGVMTNLAFDTTFIPMLAIASNSGYTQYEFNTSSLTAYHDSTFYLAFRFTNTSNYYAAFIDDINIRLNEGCMYPANVTAIPAAHSVDLTWNTGGAVSGTYVVEYQVYSATTWDSAGSTTDSTFTINGLLAATTYMAHVGYVCGIDTLWTVVTFTTACDLIPVPYFENFDSPTGTLPPCWSYTDASLFHWNRWTTHAETSGNGEMMASTGSAYEYAILPELDASFTKLQISFDAKLGNISEGDSIVFGVYDDYTQTVTIHAKKAIAGQSREGFVRFTHAYTNYSGMGNRIAISHTHNNPSDWGMAIDSIVVIALPDCMPPDSVEAHNTMYPSTADDVYFTWSASDITSQYQVYIDTITSTIAIDSVPDSLLIDVDTNYYHVPFNSLAYGARYRFFVRSDCDYEQSNWVELQNGFSTDEVWMNNSGSFDTVVGCDFIVFDNGGPVAGYFHNSNSNLVLISGDEGRELQIQRGWFSHGADANTFTVYDGIGTSGDVLYSRSATNETVTIDSVLATSTDGALTITFTSGYYAALGYELNIHCVGTALCARPVRLNAEMTFIGEATAEWEGTASYYTIYYKPSGESVWSSDTTSSNSYNFTGLIPDTTYDIYVVADCDTNGTSTPSVTIHLNTHYTVIIDPCASVSNVMVDSVSTNTATITWMSDGNEWEIELKHLNVTDTITVTTNPYTLTGLLATMEYTLRMRTVCTGTFVDPYSEWTTTTGFTTLSPDPGPGSIDGVENGVMSLYPNPASTMVTLTVAMEGDVTMSLIDMNGRTVGSWQLTDGSVTFDVSTLAKGAYFVRVTGEQSTAVRKLIVR